MLQDIEGLETRPRDFERILDRAHADTEQQVRELAERIIADAAQQLRSWGAELSEDHMRGLQEPAAFIAEMAFGVGRARTRALAVSSMSTGMGKSEIAAATGRVLTSDRRYGDIGLIIYVNTIRDLKAMIRRMGFKTRGYDPRYAVFTGKKHEALNQLGALTPRGGSVDPRGRDAAQVLFTTQAKFLWWASYLPYGAQSDFYYRGLPRQVAIWDETILPIDTLTLVPEQLENFAHALLARRFPMAADKVLAFADELRQLGGGELIKMPSFNLEDAYLLGLAKRGKRLEPIMSKQLLPCFKTGEMLLSPQGEHEAPENVETEFDEVCSALMWLRDKTVRTYRDQSTKSAVISYRDILPETIGPLLVLDANAEQRQAYRLMRENGWPVLDLHSPKRDYSRLELVVNDMAAGRRQLKKLATRKPLVDAAADAFFLEQAKGPRDVLLLHYKKNAAKRVPDMLRAVRREIKKRGGDPSRLKGLHYGNERATNKFRDVPAVIALGVQQAPLYRIVADVRGIQGLPPKAEVDGKVVEAHRKAEQMATFFQGISRTAIRKITRDGGVTPGATVYLMASSEGSMPFPFDMLPEWLPGAEPIGRIGRERSPSAERLAFMEDLKAKADSPAFGYRDFPGRDWAAVKYYLTGRQLQEITDALAADGFALTSFAPEPGQARLFRLTSRGGGGAGIYKE